MNEFSKDNLYFKPLVLEDLPRLHKWLVSPHVCKWYGDGQVTLTNVKDKYLPRIRGQVPVACFLIVCEKVPIGYIQMFDIDNYPEYKKSIKIGKKVAGMDLFIGEKHYQHRGLGSIIIRKFL